MTKLTDPARGPAPSHDVATQLDAARSRLRLASIEPEWIGAPRRQRRLERWIREPRIEPTARVWRLGALLIEQDGPRLWQTGDVVIARPMTTRGYASDLARARAEQGAAAARGGVPEGAVVNLGATVIYLDELDLTGAAGPLAVTETGRVVIEFAPGARRPLADALDEAAGLLLDRGGSPE